MKMTSYERIAMKLIRGGSKPGVYTKVINGRMITGQKSLHKTPQGIKWRRFWRIKLVRKI